MNVWSDIATVPRDGRTVWVAADEVGVFLMRWNPIGANEIFQPDPIGIWEAIDGSMTWSEIDGCGPTSWMPYSGDRRTLN